MSYKINVLKRIVKLSNQKGKNRYLTGWAQTIKWGTFFAQ